MILVAPMIGAAVLNALGAGWLFAFSTGSALLSFGLFFALRAGGHAPLASVGIAGLDCHPRRRSPRPKPLSRRCLQCTGD